MENLTTNEIIENDKEIGKMTSEMVDKMSTVVSPIKPFNIVSTLEFVSKEQYEKDVDGDVTYTSHENLKLPTRATAGSAGYDFFTPTPIHLEPGESAVIKTGIRAKIDNGWALVIMPKSGLGFKYSLKLANTIGLIDGDYYNADNEGHIMVKLENRGDKVVELHTGDKFAQGVFIMYGISSTDNLNDKIERHGGFGSTGN